MYILTVFAVLVVGLIILQIKNPSTGKYLPLVWASQLALLCCGLLGTTIGITQIGLAIGDGTATVARVGDVQCPACQAMAKGFAIAATPLSYALIIVFICSITTGVIHYRIKKGT